LQHFATIAIVTPDAFREGSMRRVDLLIRLAQQSTDERRFELGSIGRAQGEATAALAAHDQRLTAEAAAAETHADGLAAFGQWVPHAARARTSLEDRSAELGRAESRARDALREAFASTRRLELVRDAVLRQDRRAGLRRADAQADERASIRQLSEAY
jgi:hypothetical protein